MHLIPAVGIVTPNFENGTLQIYPNPMAEQSVFTFAATADGNADICIVDLSGKTICQISTLLSPGVHNFCISGINQGMYLVKVTGKTYNYCTKLVSRSSLNSKARIEYVSSVKNTTANPLKSISSTIDMPYSLGDILLYKLTTYLGGEGTAGGKMKESGYTHWTSPNTGATNSSGFTALPGSIRDYDGSFAGLGNYAHFYTSTESSSGDAWRRHLLLRYR